LPDREIALSEPASRRAVLIVGFAALIAGLFPLAIALGWFALPPSKLHAPTWVVGVGGAFFNLCGLAILMPERFSRARGFLASLAVTALAIVFNWVAFGPGERKFSATLSLGTFMAASPSSENAGRAVFGLFAVLVSLLALWGWVRWLRDLRDGERRPRRRRG
jgi:hypothetical protein